MKKILYFSLIGLCSILLFSCNKQEENNYSGQSGEVFVTFEVGSIGFETKVHAG